MPLINHNGTPRTISWTRTEHMAQVLGCSTDYFIQTFASVADGGAFELLPMLVHHLLPPTPHASALSWQMPNAAPTAPSAVEMFFDEPAITQANNPAADNLFAALSSSASLRAKKPQNISMEPSTKPLQELYKYKAMTLRKADSIAYEKTHKIDKPFDWASTQGMVGIEIEVENMKRGVHLEAYWDIKNDGSLRNHGIELVSVPLQIKQVQLALDHVYTQMHAQNEPDFSNRTSIHIHVNCRDLTQDQIFNFVLLYAIFEKHFYQVAGTRRMNSIFCVPLFRTNQMTTINEVIYGMSPNWQKYCGLNLLPLFANNVTQGYGTIEFRHLYGTNNQQEILEWINDILCLRKFACEISKDNLLATIKEMNTTSSYLSMYSQVFAKGRRLLSHKKDFEECVSNIKRELFGNLYIDTLKKSDMSPYWMTAREINAKG